MKDQPDLQAAFDHARNEVAAKRIQEIAALTPGQLRRFNTFKEEEDRKLGVKETEFRKDEKQRTIEIATKMLTEKPFPGLKFGKDATNDMMRRAREALPDFVHGRETAETKLFGAQLSYAVGNASNQYEAELAQRLGPDRQKSETAKLALIEKFKKERLVGKPPPEAFNDAVKGNPNDLQWRQAVIEAAKRQAQNSRDHDLTRDFNRHGKER
jgi:hypothetical protein